MKCRQALQALGSVLLGWPLAARAAERQKNDGRKILLFSRSVLYEHSVIQRHGNELSFAEKIFITLARRPAATRSAPRMGGFSTAICLATRPWSPTVAAIRPT